MPAYLVVRAVVAEADRRDFDTWYRTEHLPDAAKAFADVAAAEAIARSPAIQALVAEFDARWGERVARTREILEIVD